MPEETQKRSTESLRNEYSEVSQYIRHFSTLRFAIFSVFFAVQAGLVAFAFDRGPLAATPVASARIGGLLVALVFWGYQERVIKLVAHFMQVAANLENQLGYSQISTIPPSRFPVPSINTVTRIFFPLVVLFWVYTLVILM